MRICCRCQRTVGCQPPLIWAAGEITNTQSLVCFKVEWRISPQVVLHSTVLKVQKEENKSPEFKKTYKKQHRRIPETHNVRGRALAEPPTKRPDSSEISFTACQGARGQSAAWGPANCKPGSNRRSVLVLMRNQRLSWLIIQQSMRGFYFGRTGAETKAFTSHFSSSSSI